MNNTHVEVYNLSHKSREDKYEQDVEEPLVELRRAPNLRDDRSPKTLRGDDAQAPDQATDGQVHEHRLLPVARASPQSYEDAADDDHASIAKETRSDNEVLHLLDGGRGGFGRGIHHDDHGPYDAQEAADLPDETEALLEEDSGEDGGDHHGQGAQRRDQYGVDEGVCDKVADLAEDHEGHAGPPHGVLEVAIALAGSLVILLVGPQQADLLEDEGDADEEARGDGEGDADRLVDGRPGRRVRIDEAARGVRGVGSGIQEVRGCEDLAGLVHGDGGR